MPLVKVIRHGQITLPKEIRKALGIEEGDLLEVLLRESEMTVRPKVVVDKEAARDRFFEMVDTMRTVMKDQDPQVIEHEIEEAIQAVRRSKRAAGKTEEK